MRLLVVQFLLMAVALTASAQFDDLGVQVNLQGDLMFPEAATFRVRNDIASFSYLEATFAKKTYLEDTFAKKTDIPVLKTLTFGAGFIADSYNGGADVNVTLDTIWQKDAVEQVALVVDAWQVSIDTTPSVNPFDAWTFRSYGDNTYEVPKTTYWTDAEFKIVDESGALIYWVSTQRGATSGMAAHTYASHPAVDLDAKIFYTVATHDGRKWIEFVWSGATPSVFAHAKWVTGQLQPVIGGIVIQPAIDGFTVGGTPVRSIIGKSGSDRPELGSYSATTLRISPDSIEKTAAGYNIWRPALATPRLKGN